MAKSAAPGTPCERPYENSFPPENPCIFGYQAGPCGDELYRHLITEGHDLIEAAWCYRYPAKVSPEIQKRQEALPLPIRDVAWRAQLRLTRRYQHMQKKGKPHNVTVVALARELAGFMWAIAKEVKYP